LGQRALVVVSKTLQSVANKSTSDTAEHASIINEFINSRHQKVMELTRTLLDEPKLTTRSGSKLVMNNIPLDKKRTWKEIEFYLSCASPSIMKHHETDSKTSEEYEKFMELYQTTKDWKQVLNSKSHDLTVYWKKSEVDSLVSFKGSVPIPVSMEEAYSMLEDMKIYLKFDKRVSVCDRIDQYSDSQSDWYLQTSTIFPFEARDFLFTRFRHFGESQSIYFGYAINREDKPIPNGFVRGRISGSGFVLDKGEDPNKVILTYIVQFNPKGSMPNWFVSWSGNDFLEVLKSLSKYFNLKPKLMKQKLRRSLSKESVSQRKGTG